MEEIFRLFENGIVYTTNKTEHIPGEERIDFGINFEFPGDSY